MSTIDALWHALNFVAPMAVVGALVALAAKLIWRRSPRSTPLVRLALFGGAGALVGYVGAVAWLGRDGAVVAYAAMLSCAALTVGWCSLRSRLD